MERVNIKKLRSQAKIVGTIVCFGGATLMTIYKGPIVHMFWSPHQFLKHNQKSASSTSAAAVPDSKDRIIGSLLVVAGTLSWSGLFILQAAVLKKYSAELSLATLICFLGTIQATVLSLAFVRDPSQWVIGWDINLLTVVYSGVMASAVAYYVQGLCMQVKGPVFATAFSPLEMIIVAIMSSIILSENIFLGSVLGGVLIVTGLYAVLWGKVKDRKITTHKICLEVLSDSELVRPTNQNNMDDIEAACTGLQTHQFNAGDRAISIIASNNPEM